MKPGETRNPGGLAKGTRNMLGKKFCQDLLKHYEEHGMRAIEHVFANDTTNYLKLVAAAGLPTQVDVTTDKSVLDDLSPDQVSALLSAVRVLEHLETRVGTAADQTPMPPELPPVH